MDIDFALGLVSLVAFSGALWLLDSLLIKKNRLAAVAEFENNLSGGKKNRSEEEIAEIIEDLSREPLVIEYAKSFFPVLLIVLILRSFLIEPFQVPTGSMIPTIKVGDFILVNKFAYGLRLPVIGTKIVDVAEPKRGEIMVFIPPHENKYYVKRVIGLPGDTIRYEDDELYVNGEKTNKQFVEAINVATNVGSLPGELYTETIGGVEHPVQLISALGRRRNRTTWVVPSEHYFMMGDNRDNSSDSREWGVVPEVDIVGKAIAVWLHKEAGFTLPSFSSNRALK